MAHEQNCSSFALTDIAHFPQTLFLEFSIANRQNLVDYQNLRFQMCRDRKSKPHIHARRISFYRRIDITLNPDEIHYLIEFLFDLRFAHTVDSAIYKYIFSSTQFRMKAGAHC